ncbi:MAG: PhzF family phenazine biosynthesis protein [Comamonadaceae bacterium]|nr:PhzF family phenazine biosynthesis protein [Comamonadaceae bacterium]
MRIFTPGGELPFAGHPTVGTAFVLAEIGAIGADASEVVFEEGIGPVPVAIFRHEGRVTHCRLTAARLPEQDRRRRRRRRWPGCCRSADGRRARRQPPAGRAACRSSSCRWRASRRWRRCARRPCRLATGARPDTRRRWSIRWRRSAPLHWRARMFAPGLGVAEDPATGSAAAAFAGWIAARVAEPRNGTLAVRLEQGRRDGAAERTAPGIRPPRGAITAVRVGGAAVRVAEGTLHL